MKKVSKILLFVLCVLMCISFSACKRGNGTTQPGSVPDGDYIYTEGSTIRIVIPEGVEIPEQQLNDLWTAFAYTVYCNVKIVNDSESAAAHEIVIGNTTRQISKDAYTRLERMSVNPEEETRYLAYTDGDSIAIVYDEDVFDVNSSFYTAVEKLISDYIEKKSTLTLNKGVVYKGTTNPVEYQKEIDKKNDESKWYTVLQQLGGDAQAVATVNALKSYYNAIASPEVVSWLANLYDVPTGAFYYSNSGRNTEGYGPDIESTMQAFGFLDTSGILDSIGGYYNLPDSMTEPLGIWVKSLQDPNGYFYHPQWTKSFTDSKLSRRGRDLGNAVGLLKLCGLQPTYDTANGDKGDGMVFDENGNLVPVSSQTAPASALTGRLMQDSHIATAVSKVVPTSSNTASFLQNEASFRNWLAEFDIKYNSYSTCNTIAASATQIKARDNQLKKDGASWSPVAILEKWFYDNQNPDTGTWDWTPKSDANYDPNEGNNGVLKAADAYKICKIEFPRPELAINSALELIYGDYETTSVCDIYNTWYTVDLIFDNLTEFSSNSSTIISNIRQQLRADAPALIEGTLNKLLEYRRDDGSYSFGKEYSSATSQGAPVAVPYTKEGDVNATTICINGTSNHMFKVLGITKPRLFGKSEYVQFFSIIYDLGIIIKDPEIIPGPFTFDEDYVGEGSMDVDSSETKSTGEFKVIEDPRENKTGNVYLFNSKNDGGDSITIYSESNALASNCFVFETEMMIESGSNSTISQICLQRAYMLSLEIIDGKVYITDASSQKWSNAIYRDLGISVDLGVWFDLKVEFYTGEHENARAVVTVTTKDEAGKDVKKSIAISDNYYDANGVKLEKPGTPAMEYRYVQIIGISDANMKMMLDNVKIYNSQKIYDPSNYKPEELLFNVDAPDTDEIVYDFESGEIPDDFNVVKGDSLISVDNKFNLSLQSGSALEVDIPENKRTAGTNVSLFEAILNISQNAEVSAKLEFAFKENNRTEAPLVRLRLFIAEENGEKYASICDAAAGTDGKVFDAVKIPLGENVKLRIEYYSDKQTVLIYVKDTLTALSSSVCSYANKYISGKFEITNVGNKAIDISFDNVKVEGIKKSFDEATKPVVDRIIYDFEGGMPEGVNTFGSVDIVKDGTNRVVFNSSGSSIVIPLNNRGLATTVLLTEFDLKISDSVQSGSISITILDENSKAVLDFVLSIRGGTVSIQERSTVTTYASVSSFNINGNVKIAIDYFKSEGTSIIYVDGVPVLSSSVVYNTGVTDFEPASLRIDSGIGSSAVSIDNVMFETFNKVYEKVGNVGVSVDKGDTITFEGSTTSAIPNRLTTDLKTGAAKIAVSEYIMKAGTSKVLAFTSGTGNNDFVKFETTGSKDTAGINSVVFSADIKIEYVADGTFGIDFESKDGRKGYSLILQKNSKGLFAVQDVSGASSSAVPGRIFGIVVTTEVPATDEINFKLVACFGDAETVRYKTYINDELVYVSNNFYGKNTAGNKADPMLDINKISIWTYGSTAATMYIDNIYCGYEKITFTDDPLTGPVVTPDVPDTPDTPDIPDVPDTPEIVIPERFDGYDVTAKTWDTLGSTDWLGTSNFNPSVSDSKLVIKNTAWGHGLIKNTNPVLGTQHILETDIMFDNLIANAAPAQVAVISLTANDTTGAYSKAFVSIYVNIVVEDGVTKVVLADGDITDTSGKWYKNNIATIVQGQWINLKVEAVETTSGISIKVYIGGELILDSETDDLSDSIITPANMGGKLAGLAIEHRAAGTDGTGYPGFEMYLDNTYFGTVNQYQFAESGGEYYNTNGNGVYTGTAKTWDALDSTEWLGSSRFYPAVSGSKLVIKNTAWGHGMIKNTNPVAGTQHILETDIMFDKLVATNAPAQVAVISLTANDTTGAYSKAFVSIYVNVKVVDGVTKIVLADGDITDTSGKWYKNDITLIDAGEWINLRVEATETDAGISLKVYVNDGLVLDSETQTLSSSILNASNKAEKLTGLSIEHRASTEYPGFEMYLDNTYIGTKAEDSTEAE